MYEFTVIIVLLDMSTLFFQDGLPRPSKCGSTKSRALSIFSTLGSRTNSPVKKTRTPLPGQSMWTFATNFFIKQQDSGEQDITDMDSLAMDTENGGDTSPEANPGPWIAANVSEPDEPLPACGIQTPQRPHQ